MFFYVFICKLMFLTSMLQSVACLDFCSYHSMVSDYHSKYPERSLQIKFCTRYIAPEKRADKTETAVRVRKCAWKHCACVIVWCDSDRYGEMQA